ncbi:hypothetical protein NGR_b10070 (plasmid) [Sinorhizobium fredii NGR234]|uniref:Uncharacterized protein n=1 Tax=Sinorhizobium fredii (strain NBRC 101917 / NGR234) TaxID=394 RepID=C3KQV2_SINFN|nr:hypothetical protein NGR_b10070 [Sinorhizobium fredii NGR234]
MNLRSRRLTLTGTLPGTRIAEDIARNLLAGKELQTITLSMCSMRPLPPRHGESELAAPAIVLALAIAATEWLYQLRQYARHREDVCYVEGYVIQRQKPSWIA